MSLSSTSKTFWPFLQDPLCCALPPWRSLNRTLNFFAVLKTLAYLTQQDGHSHRMSNKNDYKSVFHLLTLLLAVRLPHLQLAPLWLSSNLPILLVYNRFGGMIPVHHGPCTRSPLPDLKQENAAMGRKENCTSFFWMFDKLSGPLYVSLALFTSERPHSCRN